MSVPPTQKTRIGRLLSQFRCRSPRDWQQVLTLHLLNPRPAPPTSFSASRLSKLLLRLPALRLISAAVTEELFFSGLIGNVQIDSIIPYILKMESTDYNSQASVGV